VLLGPGSEITTSAIIASWLEKTHNMSTMNEYTDLAAARVAPPVPWSLGALVMLYKASIKP
jgi:hypothetical protein